MADLKVNIGNFELQNPVLTASGTFGYGYEFEDFLDINKLGGIIVKGTTLEPRQGNAYPRMAETATGMLNAVGLQNKGVHVFIDEIQRKENAGLFLKGIYDLDLPYKFILSGSGSLELKEKIQESLTGRKRLFELFICGTRVSC